ncbi:MAG: hypothetical protein JSS53_04405 [Proteobacteria bacterium]|nr:hypothetical protein [Pseudomonadota bacterium]
MRFKKTCLAIGIMGCLGATAGAFAAVSGSASATCETFKNTKSHLSVEIEQNLSETYGGTQTVEDCQPIGSNSEDLKFTVVCRSGDFGSNGKGHKCASVILMAVPCKQASQEGGALSGPVAGQSLPACTGPLHTDKYNITIKRYLPFVQ